MEDQPFAYSHRPKPFSNDLDLRLNAHDLVAERGRSLQRYALKDIERIRISYKPQNIARLAFCCEVLARDGNSVRFDNISWRSLVSVDRQDVEFRTFVLTLATRAQQHNPGVLLEAGIAPWRYRVMQVLGLTISACLVAALVVALRQSAMIVALATLGLGLYFGLWMREFLTRNRPRVFTPDRPPENVLPAVNGS